MKKRSKKGQFYLLAAIIIVVIIAGFATINNYAQKKEIVKLYDAGDELNIESSKVLDYGVSSTTGLDDVIDDFTNQYDEYAGEDKEIYFIFGNQDSVSLITSEDMITGKISLTGVSDSNVGTAIEGKQLNQINYNPECSSGVCRISLNIGDDTYDFELKPGENFYFVLSQVVGEEQLIVQG